MIYEHYQFEIGANDHGVRKHIIFFLADEIGNNSGKNVRTNKQEPEAQ